MRAQYVVCQHVLSYARRCEAYACVRWSVAYWWICMLKDLVAQYLCIEWGIHTLKNLHMEWSAYRRISTLLLLRQRCAAASKWDYVPLASICVHPLVCTSMPAHQCVRPSMSTSSKLNVYIRQCVHLSMRTSHNVHIHQSEHIDTTGNTLSLIKVDSMKVDLATSRSRHRSSYFSLKVDLAKSRFAKSRSRQR